MKLINKIRKEYSPKIVRIFWCHWFNLIYTLYIYLVFSNKASNKVPVFVSGCPKQFSQYG